MCIPNPKLCSHGAQLGGPANSTSSAPRLDPDLPVVIGDSDLDYP